MIYFYTDLNGEKGFLIIELSVMVDICSVASIILLALIIDKSGLNRVVPKVL